MQAIMVYQSLYFLSCEKIAINTYVLSLIIVSIYFAKLFRSLYYRNVRSRNNIIKFMERKLREFKLTLCVLMPTYTLLQCYFIFLR